MFSLKYCFSSSFFFKVCCVISNWISIKVSVVDHAVVVRELSQTGRCLHVHGQHHSGSVRAARGREPAPVGGGAVCGGEDTPRADARRLAARPERADGRASVAASAAPSAFRSPSPSPCHQSIVAAAAAAAAISAPLHTLSPSILCGARGWGGSVWWWWAGDFWRICWRRRQQPH